jgi:adenine phosphoribosyltransferase
MQPGNEEEQLQIPTNRLERIREALDTIELLTLAKQYYTYTELQNLLQLPSTVLSRYVKGHVLPTGKRCRQIRTALFEAIKLGGYVADSLKELGVQAVARMNMNPRLLWFIVSHIVHLNAGRRITKVLTASEHGIPLATLTSHRLGLSLIVAAPQKCAGTESYIESELPSLLNCPYVRTVYLPSHALKKTDAVLIVTDLLSDGGIQVALERIVEKAKATTAAVWATIVAADNWTKTTCPVEFLVKMDAPSTLPSQDTSRESLPSVREEPAAVS